MNHTRALLFDAAERVGNGWWYVVGLGLFGLMSGAVWPVSDRDTLIAGAMTASVMLGVLLPALSAWPLQIHRLPLARHDAWRARLIAASLACAGVSIVLWLGFAISGPPVVEPALIALSLSLLTTGATLGVVALTDPAAMATPTRRMGLVVLAGMALPHVFGSLPRTSLDQFTSATWAFVGVAMILSAVAAIHRPRLVGIEAITAGRTLRFRITPSWLRGLPLLFVSETSATVAFSGLTCALFISLGFLDGTARETALGIIGIFRSEAPDHLQKFWVVFQALALWDLRERLKPMRALPMSTSGLALTLLALRACQIAAVWSGLALVAGAWANRWPTSIRPELLSIAFGLSALAGFGTLLARPGSIGANGPAVTIVTALVTGGIVQRFAGGASPVAHMSCCA